MDHTPDQSNSQADKSDKDKRQNKRGPGNSGDSLRDPAQGLGHNVTSLSNDGRNRYCGSCRHTPPLYTIIINDTCAR